jgi:cell fate regulator YaaT (PSP1 superfamily)
MPEIVGIRFKSCGRIYDFEVSEIVLKMGSRVVIESDLGLSIGTVVELPHPAAGRQKELKKVIRIATEEDFRQKADNERFEQEAKSFCYERVSARGLPMKLVCAEATLDRKKVVFYFTADGRIDFRELVKDLAAKFRTRIEMRQIGVRDKAKLVGGFGLCGKELCCSAFLTTFEPVSIKMAKQQDLTLNTGKLSGCCGRLMCCLGYEYTEGSKAAPVDEAFAVTRRKAVRDKAADKEADSPDLALKAPTPTIDNIEKTDETDNKAMPEGPSEQTQVQKDTTEKHGYPHKRRRRRPRKRTSQ